MLKNLICVTLASFTALLHGMDVKIDIKKHEPMHSVFFTSINSDYIVAEYTFPVEINGSKSYNTLKNHYNIL